MLLEEIIKCEIKWRLKENKIIENQIILARGNKAVDRIPLPTSFGFEGIPERILPFRLREVIPIIQRSAESFEKIFIVFYVKFDELHLAGYKLFIIEKTKIEIFEILPMEIEPEIMKVFSCSCEQLRKKKKDDFLKTLQKIQKLIP